MKIDYVSLTEISGDEVTAEQVERLARRYYWAGDYCRDKDVLEVACGTGQGVGYLGSLARSLTAGDYSEAILRIARAHYGERFDFKQFDAQALPFSNGSFDVVIIFEALYYLPDVTQFFLECRRVLRPGGTLLVATANKDLYDFTPSPQSHRYLGVKDFERELGQMGFRVECFGDTPISSVSTRQRVLRPAKALASRLGSFPKSSQSKKWLKRLVFGRLVAMPAEVRADTALRVPPVRLNSEISDRAHKVILCAAHL